MWYTARQIGATAVTCVMPKYSTPYYGTSGMEGSTTVYAWAPFQTNNFTWKAYFLTHTFTKSGFPIGPAVDFRLEGGFSGNYLIRPATGGPANQGVWVDRLAYASLNQMGRLIYMYANLVAIYDNVNVGHDNLLTFINQATEGILEGGKWNGSGDNPELPGDTARYSSITVLNNNFPQAAENATAWMQSLPTTDYNAAKNSFETAGILTLFFYDDDYFGGATAAIPSANLESKIYESAQNLTLTCSTIGSTIYFTIDGSQPDNTDPAYTSPISITTSKTVKSVAQTSGGEYSPTKVLDIVIDTSGRPAPPTRVNLAPVRPT